MTKLAWTENKYGTRYLYLDTLALPPVIVSWDSSGRGYKVSLGKLVLSQRFETVDIAKSAGVALAVNTLKLALSKLDKLIFGGV